jgi:DNA repair protein RecN (Recombination protein N)
MLRFQIQELEEASPIPGEMETLESQVVRLKNLEKLAQAVSDALKSITDGEPAAIDAVGGAAQSIEIASRMDDTLSESLGLVRDSQYRLEEAVHALNEYLESLEAEPERLEETASRIDLLKRLRRKYGDDEVEMLAFLESAREELSLLDNSEANVEEIEAALTAANEELMNRSSKLRELRLNRAEAFSAIVRTQLRDLAMDRAEFETRIAEREPTPQGIDQIEFYFSANVGEPCRPLARIASGGEMSRVMLSIKTALAGRAGVPTLIFDEVDAGLSGRAATTVASKMRQLAEHYQVVAITHLPQIAARAHTHFRIEKSEAGGRVRTRIVPLSGEDRVEELARMVSGEAITQTALANARELLAHA